MNRSFTVAGVALTLSLAALSLHADTAMETNMKAMAKATKLVGADLKITDDTKHDKKTDLTCVATIKKEELEARDQMPAKAKDLPADQQQAMTSAFQKDMDSFGTDIDTLNADIEGDKWLAARADFQKLLDDEKSGHKKFRVQKPA